MTTLTTAEVAEALNIPQSRVRLLAGQGRIQATQEGGAWQFTPEAVEAFRATRKSRGQRGKGTKTLMSATNNTHDI